MMKRFTMFAVLCVVPGTFMAQEKDAKTVAQDRARQGVGAF